MLALLDDVPLLITCAAECVRAICWIPHYLHTLSRYIPTTDRPTCLPPAYHRRALSCQIRLSDAQTAAKKLDTPHHYKVLGLHHKCT
jgi:hypothetical protein